MRASVVALSVLAATLPGLAHADALPAPSGPVLLTVVGKVDNANRGAMDPADDAFFRFNDVEFEAAAEFDLAMLEQLGIKDMSLTLPRSGRTLTFSGPLLRDVLAAAGADGETVTVQALDGFAAELPMKDIESFDILYALKQEGDYFDLGDRGPAWVLYPEAFPDYASTSDKWVFSAYLIRVE